MDREEWLARAVKKLPVAGERNRIARELRAHIEDRIDDFLAAGCPKVQAEEKAVAAMGDPEELGEALLKVHRPWVMRLIRSLQLAAFAVLVLVLMAFLSNVKEKWFYGYPVQMTYEEIDPFAAKHTVVRRGICQESVKREGMTLCPERAVIYEDGTAAILLRVEGSLFRDPPETLALLLQVRDGAGNLLRGNIGVIGRKGGVFWIHLMMAGPNESALNEPLEVVFPYGLTPFSLDIPFEEAAP